MDSIGNRLTNYPGNIFLNYLKGIKLITMKRTFWVFLALMILAATYAQETDPDPVLRPTFNISANFGGDASLMSLGFEKLFFLKIQSLGLLAFRSDG